jgi:2,3-bisphosphoglycerate-independent phosphoglycerate mutase
LGRWNYKEPAGGSLLLFGVYTNSYKEKVFYLDMKGILVIIDGLGDLPHTSLGGKTPLEAANVPNMNFLAARGELGYMYPVRPSFIPESDEAIKSIFGNDLISSSRGQLEAVGAGLKLVRGDLALRANFATVDSLTNGNIIDRRAGRTLTTYEAQQLAKEINNKVKLPCKFEFKPTVQHRGVLVLRGGFSDMISSNDINYYEQGMMKTLARIRPSKAIDDGENSQYTANIVNDFLTQSHDVLNDSPINSKRKEKGLMPANYVLVRSPGVEKPKLKQYKKWLSVSYMPLEIGFSKLSGMEPFSFDYPKLEGIDSYKNLYDGLKQACEFSVKTIQKNYSKYDYAYIHIKETDIPGHDNKPFDKRDMLEYIDQILFGFLRNFAPPNKIKVVVTGDHSTPCKLKAHSADPVPVLFYNFGIPSERVFSEKNARLGKLGRIMGNELLKKVGFVR